MADYQNTAQGLATLGRGGDSTLVHMNPKEVVGLQNLAARNGTSLTVNPNTGMPEAFNLSGLLPMVAGVGLTAASGGAISPLMAGLMIGGATAVMSGDIMSGLGAGLGAYGGASLGAGLSEAAAAGGAGGTTANSDTTSMKVSYVYGSVTLAYSDHEHDSNTDTSDQDATSWKVSYAVSDAISVTYGSDSLDSKATADTSDAEYTKVTGSYTSGGMTVSANYQEADNSNYSAAAAEDEEYVGLSLSFAF